MRLTGITGLLGAPTKLLLLAAVFTGMFRRWLLEADASGVATWHYFRSRGTIRRSTMSAEANKAIKDMTHEEAMEALPGLRAEAAEANARVHEAMERLTQTDEVPTHVDVHGDHLVISVRGKELAMTFLSDLRIPLEHVQGVEADPEIEHTLWRGWRVPGVHLPGVRFYDVHGHRDKTIVIYLKDETYDRLIVEVSDPAEVMAKINEAL
jgi:hypothetical protein